MFGLLPGREGNEPRMCSEEGQDVQSSTGNPEISEGSPGTRQAGLSSGCSSCCSSLQTEQVTLNTWAGPSCLNTNSLPEQLQAKDHSSEQQDVV